MSVTHHSAAPELARPGHFLIAAARDLRSSPRIAWLLFRADLRARHRRAFLGYLWLVLPAAVATGICVYLSSLRIIFRGATELPYPIHVLSGVVLYQVFADALRMPVEQLWARRHLLDRSPISHEAVLVCGLFDIASSALVRLAALAVALLLFGIVPGPSVLLLPLGMAALCALGLAVGLIAAPAGLLYDDVRHGLAIVAALGFFLTPVVYAAPTGGLLRFNPVTPLLEASRTWIFSFETSPAFFVVTGLAVIATAVAWLVYRLARPHLIARLG